MAAPPIRSPSSSPTGNNAVQPVNVVANGGARGGRGRPRNRNFGPRYGPRNRPSIVYSLVPNEFDLIDYDSAPDLPTFTSQGHRLSGTENSSLTPIDNEKLYYEISRYSSFATSYLPHNIMINCPKDQTCRWSSHNNTPPQYLILKLKRPALVRYIHFGKFEKSHVCNLKKFRIYGGLDENHMVLLLEAGLKNDSVPERFPLRHMTNGDSTKLPVLYIKIEPLLSWGPTFNYSIWYVELHGQDDPMYTSQFLKEYNKRREEEILRLCLKHFRQQGYHHAFKALQEQTKVQLENSLITDLHKLLVEQGDYEKTEEFITNCIQTALMDGFLSRQDYRHIWRQQQSNSTDQPGYRGGHQLVVDSEKRLIYLFGGWNGFQDLSDMWVYDMVKETWSLLCKNAEDFNGPTPRSCHKMVFDPVSGNIFILGRYLDNSIRTLEYMKSELYSYNTKDQDWVKLCDDTSQVGGPQLIYDHQMCIDIDKRVIYVFGGKILTARTLSENNTNEPEYSGLFSYHIVTNTWKQLLVDCHHPAAALPEVNTIKARITHCMVFHNRKRKLYIYGGQRGKMDMYDFLSYDVDTQILEVLNKGDAARRRSESSNPSNTVVWSEELLTKSVFSSEPPPPSYTLRATIDCDRNEIYVLSSFCKGKDRRDAHQHFDFSNCFWMYSLNTHTWTKIFMSRNNNSESVPTATYLTSEDFFLEPCPRYAHQFVYDSSTKLHYLFGGNPGKSTSPKLRLDDLWILELEKPSREEILNYCRVLIRKLCYEEIARKDPLKALYYLRSEMSSVIDHNNRDQLKLFHKLASLLFASPDAEPTYLTSEDAITEFFNCDNRSKYMITPSLGNSLDAADDNKGEKNNSNSEKELSLDKKSLPESRNKTECSKDKDQSPLTTLFKNKRICLFNQLVRLLPANMAEPNYNLSDFVVM